MLKATKVAKFFMFPPLCSLVLEPDLNSGFWEVYLCCQLIANMDIWVVSHLENLLQFLELLSCERCPDSPFPFPLNMKWMVHWEIA